jgi:nucleoside-diphosphate-sugar epimerase
MPAIRPGEEVLVTGAGGLLGGWITGQLLSAGYSVLATDIDGGDLEGNDEIDLVTGDVCDERFVRRLFASRKIAAIVHCAGLLQFTCEHSPVKAVDVNVGGTLNLIAAAKRVAVRRFVFMSTSAVYGDQTVRLDEHALIGAPHGLFGVYSATKWLAERVGLAERKANAGPEFVALRLGFVFGLGKPRSAGLSDVIQRTYGALLRGEPFEIPEAGGSECWHFVHVRDVCDAIRAALSASSDPTGVYNIAGPTDLYISLEEFIGEVAAAAKRKPRGALTGRASSGPALASKGAAIKLGFQPSFTIEQAVNHDLAYARTGGAK